MFIMHTKGNLPFVMHVKYFYRTVPHQQKHKIWTSQRCGFPETCNSEHILKSNGIKRSMSFCTLDNFSFLAYSGFDHDRITKVCKLGTSRDGANNGMATARIGFQPGSLFIFWRLPQRDLRKIVNLSLWFFFSDKSSACIKLNWKKHEKPINGFYHFLLAVAYTICSHPDGVPFFPSPPPPPTHTPLISVEFWNVANPVPCKQSIFAPENYIANHDIPWGRASFAILYHLQFQ